MWQRLIKSRLGKEPSSSMDYFDGGKGRGLLRGVGREASELKGEGGTALMAAKAEVC